jgi:hypothetical protein
MMKTFSCKINTIKTFGLLTGFFCLGQISIAQTETPTPAGNPPFEAITITKTSETVVSKPIMSRNFDGKGERVYIIESTDEKQMTEKRKAESEKSLPSPYDKNGKLIRAANNNAKSK